MSASARPGADRAWRWCGRALFVCLFAMVIVLVDRQRSQVAVSAQADERDREYLNGLFGDEQVIAMVRHPGVIRAWRPGAAQVRELALNDAQQRRLIALLTSIGTYDRAAPLRPSPASILMRCEDSQGSITLVFCLESALLSVYRNGNAMGQAVFTPALPQIRTLLQQICPLEDSVRRSRIQR